MQNLRWFSTAAKDGNFVDYLLVKVFAGKGGNGCAAFDRTKVNVRGRPSGGNGGHGGDIIFCLDPTKNSLQHVQKTLRAANGQSGGKGNMVGARGEDLILGLPPGTIVKEVLDREAEDDRAQVNRRIHSEIRSIDPIDGPNRINFVKEQICEESFEFGPKLLESRTVARGGRGGRGNISMGRNNHDCERGFPGEAKIFELDLNTIADIGLVGLPNAGKSSFLAAVSNAHPKIAPYPFTTINPYVGTIQYADYTSITVADIPGLIEGASRNIGLGHKFLKHVVKARALAFVIDFSRPDPLQDFRVLCRELDLYREGLSDRCRLVIANKIDLLVDVERTMELMRRALSDRGIQVLPISARHYVGITETTDYLKRLVLGDLQKCI